METRVLVLYDAHGPLIERLAEGVAQGAAAVEGVTVTRRRVPEATREDLVACHGLVLGCPNWSGIPGALKTWLDDQGDLWEEGTLAGRAGGAFVTGRGRHSGLEFTLLGLLHWMLACGMVVVGLPWSEKMRTSGSYYGATAAGDVQPQDVEQARALGARVAQVARLLAGPG